MVFVLVILIGIGGVAFITLLERKILGASQLRLGPNKVSFFGVLQPVMDGVKLLIKQNLFVTKRQLLFYFSPIVLLMLFLFFYSFILPWHGMAVSFKATALIYFSCLGINAYFIVVAGWSSLRSFSKLGRIRGILQRVSYEVSFILALVVILILIKDFLFLMPVRLNELILVP